MKIPCKICKTRKVKKVKKVVGKKKEFEMIDWSLFENVKVLEEGVCGLKVCCIRVDYKGKKYVIKEMKKTFNYGRDYMFMDNLKKMFGLRDLDMKRIESNKGLSVVDKKIKSLKGNWELKEKNTIYCMMNYKKNIGDIGKNKELLKDFKVAEEMIMIRLFNGLFNSSDNILRNILVDKKNRLYAIDENDIFGKRKTIFNNHDYAKKIDRKIIEKCLKKIIKIANENKEKIEEKMKLYGFGLFVEKFNERLKTFEKIVFGELNYY